MSGSGVVVVLILLGNSNNCSSTSSSSTSSMPWPSAPLPLFSTRQQLSRTMNCRSLGLWLLLGTLVGFFVGFFFFNQSESVRVISGKNSGVFFYNSSAASPSVYLSTSVSLSIYLSLSSSFSLSIVLCLSGAGEGKRKVGFKIMC